jgi:hypothetical protein
MQWEFTSDYRIVDEVKDPAGGAAKLVPQHRFWFVKHFCNLTPPKADVLATASDHPEVLLTAFAAGPKGRETYTLHLANLGAGRRATVRGAPAAVAEWRAVRTSKADSYRALAPVAAKDGVLELPLPARSLTTLTTLPAEGGPAKTEQAP